MYHGGAKIEGEVKSPFFLYDNISTAIYYTTGYSSVEDNWYISEYRLSDNAKVLDLMDSSQGGEKIIDDIMKKIGLEFEDEYLYVKDSIDAVGQDVIGYDINLCFYPEFRQELLERGYNVLKTYTVFENASPIGFAVLDSSAIILQKEFSLKSDDDYAYLTVTQDNNDSSKVGESFKGETGYGEIQLEKIRISSKKKM